MIKLMVLEYTIMLMGLDTLGSGRMIYNMGQELKHGMIIQNIKDNTAMVENTAQDNIFGMMDQNLKEIGLRIK